jgi:SAM-dependent methyltransferase
VDSAREYNQRTLEHGAELERYTRWLLHEFRPFLHGRVIEVGSGIGNIAKYFIDNVSEAVLVEPDSGLYASLAREMSGRANVRTARGTLEEIIGKDVGGSSVAPGTFDAAIMINVLEHIQDDVGTAKRLLELLKPGGVFLIFVPALPFLYGSLDSRVGHLRRYTSATLRDVIERAGYDIEALHYFDMLGMIPWLVTGRLLKERSLEGLGAGTSAFYDRFIVPVCSIVDRVTGRPIGKNLVCIAMRPRV